MRISPQEDVVENSTEEEVGVEHLVIRFRNTPPGEREALRDSWRLTSVEWMKVYRAALGLSELETFAARKAVDTTQTAADVIRIIPELNGKRHRSIALEELSRFRHLTPEELDLMQGSGSRELTAIASHLAGPNDGKYRN